MKRLISLLIIFLSIYSTTRASHIVGGEIGWKCLTNGKYVFFMTVYRDCTGITFPFRDENLDIVGSPLPKNDGNQFFSSILLKPDSARWIANRNGDTSPRCAPQIGNEKSCAARDEGTMQAFYYESDPITMDGVPPRRGWEFYWTSPCCRPGNVTNVNTPGSMLLRAIMFPTKARDNANPCKDSSPEFKSLPTSFVCRGQEFTYNATAIDTDLDSLIYSWDRPYNPPIESPEPLIYKAGYNYDNPTPDKTFDTQNIPSTLNPISGTIDLAIYSGFGTEKFLNVYRVDSYRDGVIIGSVFREIPLSVFNCPRLLSGGINNPPEVFIDGKPSQDTIVTITAGQEVRIPLQVIDLDDTGYGTGLQVVTAVPDGLMFSNDRVTPTPCQVQNAAGQPLTVEPCAYLQNQTPSLGGTPPVIRLVGFGGIATEFVWKTDCRHVSTKTGQPGTLEGIYNFILRVTDDHCPIPGVNYITITVRVKDPFPLDEPIMKGASVGLDGSVTYQWVPPIDSAFTFHSYSVQSAAAADGNQPSFLGVLNPDLRIYQQERRVADLGIYRPIGGIPANGPNLLNKVVNRDWYLRMTSISGCNDDVPSDPSEPVRVIEVDAAPSGQFPNPPRSAVTLNWNRPKPLNSATKPYFTYESKTHYYIWENDSVNVGKVDNPGDWYLRGDTSATTYSMLSNVCGEVAAFRIEARDTVVTWRQGTAPPRFPTDSLDTLVYSTFSVIDTMFMIDRGFIPKPRLDTLEVLANGDVYFRVNTTNSGTIGSYRIYASVVNQDSLLASFDLKDQDSIIIPGQGANNAVRRYVIQGIDDCNPSNVERSLAYNTFIPTGTLTQPRCSAIYRLNWSAPDGFASGVSGYRIYVDSSAAGNNFRLVETINNGNTTSADLQVRKGKTFRFQVVAYDENGAVNMSAIHIYNTPNDLRSFDIVPPPSLRCAYVEDNGEVSVSWVKRRDDEDPTGNFEGPLSGYEFQYRLNNGAWNNVNDAGLLQWEDTSILITGINAQNGKYDIRARVLSGCAGDEPSEWNTISTIDVNAMAQVNDPEKKANISWNSTGVDYGNPYSVFKDTFNLRYEDNILNANVSTESAIDNRNGPVCDGIYNYYVTIEDQLTGCVSRSNIDSTRIVDRFPPEPIHLDYVTYNLVDGNLIGYWSAPNPGDVDSLFFTTTDGFNSGLQAYRQLVKEKWNISRKEVTIPFNQLDARDSSVKVGAITQDACDNRSSEEDLTFHRTMDINVEWSVCDSSMTLTWNPYVGFNEEFDVEYRVYRSFTGEPAWEEINGSTTTDTVYVDKIQNADTRYSYHVRASSTDPATPSGFVSNSNIDSDSAIFEDVPRFGYLRYVTVLPNNQVELEFNKDTLINISGYNIYRGTDRLQLNPIAYIDYDDVRDDSFFNFVDADVDVNGISYFYKVVTQSACEVAVDTSNFGRSILLNVNPDNEALTNTLSWNEYTEWDSTVAYYNVYRGIDRDPTDEVFQVVSPSEDGERNSFVDDVYDETVAIGSFCYQVEAVQGPVSGEATNGYPNNLDPATSKSNVVCVTQKPLFYVPNAFAPDGVNKRFGPKGQYFDFSLFEMVIYNRWGEKIFETRDIEEGWDGTVNGEPVQLGSYVYMIRFIDADGQEHRRKGTVTLIR